MHFPASTLISFLAVHNIALCVYFLFILVIAVYFFKKKKQTPSFFILFAKIAISISVIEFVYIIGKHHWLFGEWPDPLVIIYFLRLTNVIGLTIAGITWMQYFKQSRRVKGTFIK